MDSKASIIETPVAHTELVKKLRDITVDDFNKSFKSPDTIYYGQINSHSFKIRHIRYGPMSNAPYIQGEILDGVNDRSRVKIQMDIKEPFLMVKKMYYGTLLPLGTIIMLLSALVMWGTNFQWPSLFLSSSFIIVAFLIVALEKSLLTRTKKNELSAFISRIEGRVLSEPDTYVEHKGATVSNSTYPLK